MSILTNYSLLFTWALHPYDNQGDQPSSSATGRRARWKDYLGYYPQGSHRATCFHVLFSAS